RTWTQSSKQLRHCCRRQKSSAPNGNNGYIGESCTERAAPSDPTVAHTRVLARSPVDSPSMCAKVAAMRAAATPPTTTDAWQTQLRCRLALEKSLVLHPAGARLRPGGVRMIRGTHAEVVSRGGVDVQLRRNAGALQSQIHDRAVGRVA